VARRTAAVGLFFYEANELRLDACLVFFPGLSTKQRSARLEPVLIRAFRPAGRMPHERGAGQEIRRHVLAHRDFLFQPLAPGTEAVDPRLDCVAIMPHALDCESAAPVVVVERLHRRFYPFVFFTSAVL